MNSIYTPIGKDTFSKIEEEFDYEILKIGKFTKQPPLINHSIFMNHFKIIFFQHGYCGIIVEDQEYRVGPGDLMIIPSTPFILSAPWERIQSSFSSCISPYSPCIKSRGSSNRWS